ncbi:Sigma-E factor regulatory protein RseB [Vibrio stylophorae]|uniref:Sigma-E factor regulatory protein RseB n=1 Tax=Vibrio stylophorae TaxID=659351 RepID=A0ABN8DX07_9VIBR|nr:sigma-E factor regulatory protein RseB [Vibrio stylophorae]CAH0534370.1 Sigma-E factor regulatory protein RseB [Vibrio stylophorae]
MQQHSNWFRRGWILFASFCLIASAQASNTPSESAPKTMPPEQRLQQMVQAVAQENYELAYYVMRSNSIETLRYRHGVEQGESYAQLLFLSGPRREVIRRGDDVSYFEHNLEPFTVRSGEMVGPLPALLQVKVEQLAKHYNFIALGRGREAGSACQVIRIASKDGLRYSYVVWVDEHSGLPLRADLLDRNGAPLEQYRAIAYAVDPRIGQFLATGMAEMKLPPAIKGAEKKNHLKLPWQLTWVPEGFVAVSENRHRLIMTERPVESMLFSDGLFSFSVYVAEADSLSVKEQLARQGRRTLYSNMMGDVEVTVVGDIPPTTARKIADSFRAMSTAPKPEK